MTRPASAWSELIRRATLTGKDYRVDWIYLKLNDPERETILSKDPFQAHDERVERLIGQVPHHLGHSDARASRSVCHWRDIMRAEPSVVSDDVNHRAGRSSASPPTYPGKSFLGLTEGLWHFPSNRLFSDRDGMAPGP